MPLYCAIIRDMGEDHRPNPDQESTDRRLTVAQAAEVLGITPEAVRGRINRRTLRAVREEGRVYVLLPARPIDDKSDVQLELNAALRDQIAMLREQLDAEREANRENRRIIAALTSRIPELESGSSPDVRSEAPRRSQEATEPRSEGSGPGEPEARSSRLPWWRRLFGEEER